MLGLQWNKTQIFIFFIIIMTLIILYTSSLLFGYIFLPFIDTFLGIGYKLEIDLQTADH